MRKLYAGSQGRFSLDLDFSLADPDADPHAVVGELVRQVDGTRIGPFTYGVTQRRGKWSLTVTSPFGSDDTALTSKLDVSAAVWLDPVRRAWVSMPVHATYGYPPLPSLTTVRLEENIAEKISRLNRITTARDMYDLAWIASHQRELGGLDVDLIRRLAVLKIWADTNGVTGSRAHWKPGHEPRAFDPEGWLRIRGVDEFDLEDIGALAVPVPQAADLAAAVSARYGFLADLSDAERQLAAAREQDRHLALRLLAELPGARLASIGLY